MPERKKLFKVTLAGKPWKIRFSSRTRKHYGWVDWQKREIVISTKQTPSQLLDTVIHEILHVLMPYGDEEFITAAAAELSDVIETLDIE